MKRILLLNIIFAVVLCAGETNLLLSVKGSYTTSTRFLYNIDKQNSYNDNRSITSNLGYGTDLRWNVIWERFFIGVSAEKIQGSEIIPVQYPQYNYLAVPYEEGFDLLAIELSGYYVVPISSEKIQFYLGGGIGMYDGVRNFSIAGVKSETISTISYSGIHVMTGIDYRLFSHLGVRFEIKFRDPHFDSTTKFEQRTAQYQGYTIQLPQEVSVTKVNLFGVNYSAGIIINL